METKTIEMNTFMCTGYVNYNNDQYKVLVYTDYKNVNQKLRERVIEELGKMNITGGSLSLTKHGKVKEYSIDEYGLSYSKNGGGGGVTNKFVTVMVLK